MEVGAEAPKLTGRITQENVRAIAEIRAEWRRMDRSSGITRIIALKTDCPNPDGI
jgi:hypothetical protein